MKSSKLIFTEQDYYKQVEKYNNLGLGIFVDTCVDRENVYPMTEKDEDFWFQMYICLKDSVQMRAEEAGINVKDFN